MVNGRDVFVSEIRECFCDFTVEGQADKFSFERGGQTRLRSPEKNLKIILAPLISEMIVWCQSLIEIWATVSNTRHKHDTLMNKMLLIVCVNEEAEKMQF